MKVAGLASVVLACNAALVIGPSGPFQAVVNSSESAWLVLWGVSLLAVAAGARKAPAVSHSDARSWVSKSDAKSSLPRSGARLEAQTPARS